MSEEREQIERLSQESSCYCGEQIVWRGNRWVHKTGDPISCYPNDPDPSQREYEAEPEVPFGSIAVDPVTARLRVELRVAESQRDTLRTALIEAQSWIGDWHFTPTAPILARIREALEGTA